jgi:hypothetical protein
MLCSVTQERSVVTYEGFAWLIIMGSGLDDCIYWHFCNNYNQLQQHTINLQPNPSSLTTKVSMYSASSFTTDCKRPSLSPITLQHGPHTENTLRTLYPRKTCLRHPATAILYCWPDVFADTLPNNGYPIVVMCISGKVFTGSLPNNGYASQYFTVLISHLTWFMVYFTSSWTVWHQIIWWVMNN